MRAIPTIKQQAREDTIAIVKDLLLRAESGEIAEVSVHYRTNNGENYLVSSSTINCHEQAGWLLDMAMQRLK
jgi:hypothetical protein